MKILDFELFGNIVKLYLGETVEGIFGDDWNDTPYEHNAGCVYDKFYTDTIEIAFPLSTSVYEPCFGYDNSPYCKNDFLFRKVPFLLFGEVEDSWKYHDFNELLEKVPTLHKLYIGDDWDNILFKYGDLFTLLDKPRTSNCTSIEFKFRDGNDKSVILDLEDIEELRLENIIKRCDIVKTPQGFSCEEENKVHFFKISIPSKCNTIYSTNTEFHLITSIFEKLSKKEIKSISFIYDDNSKEEYALVFRDSVNSGISYENVYQYSLETSDGLHIVITDDMEQLDYYKDTEMETKSFDDDYLDNKDLY